MAPADGADEQAGLFDPFPLTDNFDDVLHLLNIPVVGNAEQVLPPPAVAPAYNVDQPACSHGSTGVDDLLNWPAALLDNFSIGGGGAPPSGVPVHGGPSASAAVARQEDVLDCSGCQVLREVMHSNGLEATKLCIHGGAGVFYHATVDVYRINSEGLAPALMHQSCTEGRDYVWVKHFLTEYARQRAGANFAVVHDSLSAFYDVLCTTMNNGGGGGGVDDTNRGGTRNGGDRLIVDAGAVQQPTVQGHIQAESGPSQPSYTTEEQGRPSQPVARRSLAMQRERTSRLRLDDIAPYFHLPMAEAAIRIQVCPTVLKGVCRKFGIERWPYRKVQKIDKQIAKLRTSDNVAAATNEIEMLVASRRRIYAGLE